MTMKTDEDRVLVAALRARIAAARAVLHERMGAMGLTEAGGWTIAEELCNVADGSELVLRPMHLKHDPPEFEVKVCIAADGVPL